MVDRHTVRLHPAQVIPRHDQTKNLAELNEVLAEQAFWAKFPPKGVDVESRYVAMGLGYIVTLRVSPPRLRAR